MSEEFEQAKESLEHVAEEREGGRRPKIAAIIIAVLAACLALTEFVEKDAETNYLFNHIAVSDTWAQYQDKLVRRTIFIAEAELLGSLADASKPSVEQRIATANATAARMRSEPGADGMEQLAQRARNLEHLRDHELHRKNMLEIASGGLQIAIVLASISVVIDLPLFLIGGVLLGVASMICGLFGGLSLI